MNALSIAWRRLGSIRRGRMRMGGRKRRLGRINRGLSIANSEVAAPYTRSC